MTSGALDTSTVILLPRVRDVSSLPDSFMISAVTLAELTVGPLVSPDAEEALLRQRRLQQAEADLQVLPFDREAARAFGEVALDLRTVPHPDAP